MNVIFFPSFKNHERKIRIKYIFFTLFYEAIYAIFKRVDMCYKSEIGQHTPRHLVLLLSLTLMTDMFVFYNIQA